MRIGPRFCTLRSRPLCVWLHINQLCSAMSSAPDAARLNHILRRSHAGFRVMDVSFVLNCHVLPFLIGRLFLRLGSRVHALLFGTRPVCMATLRSPVARERLCRLSGASEGDMDRKALRAAVLAVMGPLCTYCLSGPELAASTVDTLVQVARLTNVATVECVVCMEDLHVTDANWRALRCGHTACHSCLAQLAQQAHIGGFQLLCPTCAAPIDTWVVKRTRRGGRRKKRTVDAHAAVEREPL